MSTSATPGCITLVSIDAELEGRRMQTHIKGNHNAVYPEEDGATNSGSLSQTNDITYANLLALIDRRRHNVYICEPCIVNDTRRGSQSATHKAVSHVTS